LAERQAEETQVCVVQTFPGKSFQPRLLDAQPERASPALGLPLGVMSLEILAGLAGQQALPQVIADPLQVVELKGV